MSSSPTPVEITSRRYVIPADCPCCGATPDTEIAVPIARAARDRATPDSARTADFPYCQYCVEHVSRWESAGTLSAGLIVTGIIAGIVIAVAASVPIGIGVAIALVAVALLLATSRRTQARHGMRESCSTPGKSVAFLGWNGSSSGFIFESISYAAKFAEQNTSKLVEDPRLRKLLERYKLARIAVPTPAAAVTAIPPPLEVAEWVAKIAKTPGRVARRTAVVRALDAFKESKEREQIIRAVSALEVAALLAPLDRMPGGDRQRYLRDAIQQVRYDNIPEELQQEMLRELEDRLAKA